MTIATKRTPKKRRMREEREGRETVQETVIVGVVAAVKQKRELSTLGDAVVRRKVEEALKKDAKLRKRVEAATSYGSFAKSKEHDALKKSVRESLRKVYGLFDAEKPRRKRQVLATLAADTSKARDALALHQSSRERLPHYLEIYRRIFALTGEPRAILDLGCGYNPYSYDQLGCTPLYIAVDLPNEALAQIKEFFRKKRVRGLTHGLDLVTEHEKLAELATVDVAFLFKLLDSLETAERNVSAKLLDAVKAEWLVVSFPTVSIGGKKRIPRERRAWFEKLLRRKRWTYRAFAVGDEAFYVIRKR